VMFANGAGIAPMRSLLQEKVRNQVEQTPTNLGQIALFFGTRTDGDYLFKGDYETAIKCGCLKEFKIAFSRQKVSQKIKILGNKKNLHSRANLHK